MKFIFFFLIGFNFLFSQNVSITFSNSFDACVYYDEISEKVISVDVVYSDMKISEDINDFQNRIDLNDVFTTEVKEYKYYYVSFVEFSSDNKNEAISKRETILLNEPLIEKVWVLLDFSDVNLVDKMKITCDERNNNIIKEGYYVTKLRDDFYFLMGQGDDSETFNCHILNFCDSVDKFYITSKNVKICNKQSDILFVQSSGVLVIIGYKER